MNPRQIAEENAAYRRGVVMGLTMAEAGILIIFVLLLLIGFNDWVRAVEETGKVDVPEQRLSQLEGAEQRLRELVKSLDLPEDATDEEIKTMVRAIRETAATPAGKSALREVKEALEQVRRVKEQIQGKQPNELARAVERQAFRIANQEGQLKHLQQKLEKAGLGKGERPCWVKPDGTIEFLFDVVLASDGIRMRENLVPERGNERAALPRPVTDPSEVLTPGEFLRRTQGLYDSSLAANCRFFVTIFDATGPSEKELYKELLRTVEGHFYKRLSSVPAPF